jgi:hypothetical protein
MSDIATSNITLTIDLPHFNKASQKYLLSAIAAFLDIPRDAVHIVSIKKGSVRITVKIPEKAKEVLLTAISKKILNYINILAHSSFLIFVESQKGMKRY